MKNKPALGWAALLIISFLPAIVWYILRPNPHGLSAWGQMTQSIGQLCALIGMTMFALTFVLSTRWKVVEDLFDGLDKVYVVHSIIGASALVLILFHPIFLVLKFIPNHVKKAALYLMPSTFWSVNFGIIAILGLIFLIYLTMYTKIKYNHWKMSHRFLGIVFIFAVLHIFLVRGTASRDNIFAGYYVYATIVSLIGLACFAYTQIAHVPGVRDAMYKVETIEKKGKGICEITIQPVYKPIKYDSGQFIFLRFFNKDIGSESHPFTIASKTNDAKIKVVVKDLGDFTKKLELIKAGERVAVEGPYGRFNPKAQCEQIWIAGGIGITPFLGMAEDIKENKCRVDLYYSVRSRDELIESEKLRRIEKETKNRFKMIPWISSEQGRITVDIISEKSKGFKQKQVFICGPSGFKREMSKNLMEAGVQKDNIHEEEFSFR